MNKIQGKKIFLLYNRINILNISTVDDNIKLLEQKSISLLIRSQHIL